MNRSRGRTLADAGWDPVAGGRLRKMIESSPGWHGAAALERDSGVTATTIGSWFRGAPPRIPNILKVAPILGRTPLELYGAWFDEPSSGSGLERIANEIKMLRQAIQPPTDPVVDRAIAAIQSAEQTAARDQPQSTSRPRRSDHERRTSDTRRASREGETA